VETGDRACALPDKNRELRSIKNLDMELGETTVLIGPKQRRENGDPRRDPYRPDAAVGQRGTGFTGNDVYAPDEHRRSEDSSSGQNRNCARRAKCWHLDPDMVAALEDILALRADGRNSLILRTTCAWSAEKEAFEPAWEFLDAAGVPMTGKSQRATNLTGFFVYLPLFWLGALRDAANEFTARIRPLGPMLRSGPYSR